MLMLTDQAEEIDWFDYKSPKSKQAADVQVLAKQHGWTWDPPYNPVENPNSAWRDATLSAREYLIKRGWKFKKLDKSKGWQIKEPAKKTTSRDFIRQQAKSMLTDQAEAQWEEEFAPENYSLQQLIDWYKANALSADANKLEWVAQEIQEDYRMNGQPFDPLGSYDFPEKDFREEDEPLRRPSKKSLGDDEAFVEDFVPDPGERSPVFKKFGTYMIWILLLLASSMSFSNQVSTQRVNILPEHPVSGFAELPAPPTMDLGYVNDTPLGPNMQYFGGLPLPMSETDVELGLSLIHI